jgi:hypothetical protein
MNSRALRPSRLLVAVLLFRGARRSLRRGSRFAPDRLARIDKFLQAAVDSNRIAGATALVLRDGKPLREERRVGGQRNPRAR